MPSTTYPLIFIDLIVLNRSAESYPCKNLLTNLLYLLIPNK